MWGRTKTLYYPVMMDNSKIDLTEKKVAELIKSEAYDINSILLVADAFVTTRAQKQKPYDNPV